MRIPRRQLSFCLSLFSLEFSYPVSPRNFLGVPKGIHTLRLNRSCAIGAMGENLGTVMKDKRTHSLDVQQPCIWSSSVECNIDIGKQIFCNRSLNMKNIVAVGFDMDYTLAQYKPETFESLAYEGTIRKLVYDLAYSEELLNWSFDWKYMVRGLVLDKRRGNILKMDRHKYVKVAYHGFKELSKDDKVETYGSTLVRDSFDEPDYALIDTLFSLAEAYLFAQLVDFKDNNPDKVPEDVDYARMYKDVRAAVDMCHRDGTLKQMVAKDPERFINVDTSIVPMLKMLRDSGRSTFLVTNSLWDYTNVVMNFLCTSSAPDGDQKCNLDWLQYFDVVITGRCLFLLDSLSIDNKTVPHGQQSSTCRRCCLNPLALFSEKICTNSAKPGFFHEDNRANLFGVEPKSGMLLNTDNGSPLPQVGNTSEASSPTKVDKSCKVFQGGNVMHLHKLLQIESSSQVLYVGDHIYGDILRSKKALGWRTMLVVPELGREVELLWELRKTRKQLQLLRNDRDAIEDKIHHLKWSLKFEDVEADEKERLSAELHQLERFACLYSSQVTNLSLYSPAKYYRPSEDFMPHEFGIIPL
ncbi:Cytosolic purine 5'-nucleotidase [Cucurbita argyrosperma subsp. argyrosperma]|nr:Cytosolic purine 5'-nucleotidase [Cucurbita argyrosperma subsp. argyrosperma]